MSAGPLSAAPDSLSGFNVADFVIDVDICDVRLAHRVQRRRFAGAGAEERTNAGAADPR